MRFPTIPKREKRPLTITTDAASSANAVEIRNGSSPTVKASISPAGSITANAVTASGTIATTGSGIFATSMNTSGSLTANSATFASGQFNIGADGGITGTGGGFVALPGGLFASTATIYTGTFGIDNFVKVGSTGYSDNGIAINDAIILNQDGSALFGYMGIDSSGNLTSVSSISNTDFQWTMDYNGIRLGYPDTLTSINTDGTASFAGGGTIINSVDGVSVTSGGVYCEGNLGLGDDNGSGNGSTIVMKDPTGTQWGVRINTDGVLQAFLW